MITPIKRGGASEAVIMHLNVTENIKAKQKQQESEEYYKSLFENHPDPICSFDLEGRFISANHAISDLIDVRAEDLINTSFIKFLDDESVDFFVAKFQEASKGIPQNFEKEVKLYNGKEVYLNITSIPILIASEITGVYYILKDITLNKKNRVLLADSARRLNNILESITDGFVALDRNLVVTYWNKEAERLLRIERDEIIGKNLIDATEGTPGLNFYPMYRKALKENKAVHFIEYYPPIEVWFELSVYPSEEGLSIYFRDITDKKKNEDNLQLYTTELEKTNYELDQFVYRASHDLRAPLVSVLGLINIFKLEANEEKRNGYLILMEKSINKLDHFIQDIIFYSKNSRTDLILTEIDFDSLINETREHVQFMDDAKKIQFLVNGANIRNFYSDYNRLSVILNNIISNAIRYHDPRKDQPYIKTTVSYQQSGGVRISVEDNGQGIDKKDHKKIFDMFYRATQNTVGSGLGLYIVSENLKKLRGKIDVESEIGRGTTFIIEIPNLKK